MASTAQIFEVGLRDGLQNESAVVQTDQKLLFASGLVSAGVSSLELGSFVRSDRVPQMADTDALFQAWRVMGVLPLDKTWALVPNLKGLERALTVGAKSIALFTAVSETFNQKNIGMSVDRSLEVMRDVVIEARKHRCKVRAYLSTAFGCPFEGPVAPARTLKAMDRIQKLGVDQISVGDTIGVADPKGVDKIVRPALKRWSAKKLALHFHDTRGTALANVLRSYELGARVFDSSAGGLGGCPFAPGAAGNVSTEDLVYMFRGMGIETGIDFNKLCQVSLAFAQKIRRPVTSKSLQAFAYAQKNPVLR